jgi:hypothetical protein
MLGATGKFTWLLVSTLTVTITFPVVAAAGTGTVILVEFQLVGVAATPLNVTVLDPWVVPKLEPLMVTEVPVGPDDGESMLMVGTRSVKYNPSLFTPPTVTIT